MEDDNFADLFQMMNARSKTIEPELRSNFKYQIKLIRKVVYYFKKTVKETDLKKISESKALLADCKIGRSSLTKMIDLFIIIIINKLC